MATILTSAATAISADSLRLMEKVIGFIQWKQRQGADRMLGHTLTAS